LNLSADVSAEVTSSFVAAIEKAREKREFYLLGGKSMQLKEGRQVQGPSPSLYL
jgi:hypothetical protein